MEADILDKHTQRPERQQALPEQGQESAADEGQAHAEQDALESQVAHLLQSELMRVPVAASRAPTIVFTERERDVLHWAALGKSAGVTAQILGISEKTVRKARESAGRKLNSHNIVQSIATATRLGLL